VRNAVSADFATGTGRIQHLPAHYLETVLGKDGVRGVIFPAEETELEKERDALLWDHATAGVKQVLQRECCEL